jgi:general stress protein CsbA
VNLTSWHDFYMTVGSAAAALVGLLFVGLSLHIRVVVANPDVRSLARVTLTNFVLVLLVALLELAPITSAQTVSVWLVTVALVSLGLVLHPAVEAMRKRYTLTLRLLILRFAFSAICYAGVVAAGALVATGDAVDAQFALMTAVIAILILAVRNTWDLLVTVADRGHQAAPDASRG